MKNYMKRALIIFLPPLFQLACTANQEPVEFYQIISHEAYSGEWVIIRENKQEHSRVKITAVCDFYKLANHESVVGPDSCNLIVGQNLVPNRLQTRPGEFLDIWQSGDKLFITKGKGADRIHQQFSIRSAKVLSQ